MDAQGKERARQALKTINSRGCTNLSGGVLEGINTLNQAPPSQRNEVASVLLMTDGLANNGITDPTQLVQVTKQAMDAMTRPATLYTFGYGADHDSSLLSNMATSGNGTYYFMETPDSIPQAFAECLGGLMSVVAQNITMDITCETPNVHITTITTPFNTHTVVEGRHYRLDVGDVFSEEQRDILVDLKLPAIPSPDTSYPLFTTKLSCFNIAMSQQQECSHTSSIVRTGDGDTRQVVKSVKVDEERNRIHTARAMEQAVLLGDQGRVDEARKMLLAVQSNIEQSSSYTKGSAQAQNLTEDLQGVVQQLTSQSTYNTSGSKKLRSKARKHWVQRATECDDTSVSMYTNATKLTMKSRFR
jgi:hypothetical protein